MKRLKRYNGYLGRRLKRRALRKKYPTSVVGVRATVDQTILEGKNVISNDTDVSNSMIGFATIIGSDTGLTKCKIGRFCSISWGVHVAALTHPLDMVSTHTGFYKTCNTYPFGKGKTEVKEFLETKNGYRVEIGNDVWIGEGVLIKGGVIVGDGAVIGMNAVVTKDVEPYAIVGGNPARVIRYRMSQEQIEEMLRIRWWDWPEEIINERKDDFADPASFIQKYGSQSSR